ncbi:MAG: T9SS type A sorting domain-containing protein [Chitinophagales bacterium]
MKKTFTLLLILFASLFFIPKTTFAKNSLEASNYDARYGDKDIIKFYPNPMTTDATVKISEDVDLERSKVTIVFYNIVGSEVFKVAQVKDYEQKITKDNFKNAGIYFYQLKIDDKIITTGRITVK